PRRGAGRPLGQAKGGPCESERPFEVADVGKRKSEIRLELQTLRKVVADELERPVEHRRRLGKALLGHADLRQEATRLQRGRRSGYRNEALSERSCPAQAAGL